MESSQYIIDHYSNYDEDSRLTTKSGSVEFLTTMRYIGKYIKPGDRVLEVGAATGRYSHALARQGHIVDAVELVEHNIELFRKNTQDGEKITITQGNALDLSAFPDNLYDITLLLGPLYHLYTKEDKQQAIRESIRVTKHGGVIFTAYVISDLCLLHQGFKHGVFNIPEFIDKGMVDPITFATKSEPKDLFELVRKEDIDDLMSAFTVTRLNYVASTGCTSFINEEVDAMNDESFELYLKYHFATCEREDLIGMTSHSVDIFRK
ncbi:MAG: class I SAM-dependent methyltransferase [Defluviitaleaceae bacterium]|nr:class I SAM-dependent methyltransferase [Defluviitaleaceae bacterium]